MARMSFHHPHGDEPEINLIPFIDVLLVVLIFLMLSTTYSKFTELQITLPVADAEKSRDRPNEIIVAVAADGREALARFPGTIVVYMGVRRLPEIVERLTAAGRDPSEPAAIVERGTLAGQQTVTATLGELPGMEDTSIYVNALHEAAGRLGVTVGP